jgi:hypothetical protein
MKKIAPSDITSIIYNWHRVQLQIEQKYLGAGGCTKKGVLLEFVEKMNDLCDKSAMS